MYKKSRSNDIVRAALFLYYFFRKGVILMGSNDFGDILLMLLDDDLFWKGEPENTCGDITTTTHQTCTSETA